MAATSRPCRCRACTTSSRGAGRSCSCDDAGLAREPRAPTLLGGSNSRSTLWSVRRIGDPYSEVRDRMSHPNYGAPRRAGRARSAPRASFLCPRTSAPNVQASCPGTPGQGRVVRASAREGLLPLASGPVVQAGRDRPLHRGRPPGCTFQTVASILDAIENGGCHHAR